MPVFTGLRPDCFTSRVHHCSEHHCSELGGSCIARANVRADEWNLGTAAAAASAAAAAHAHIPCRRVGSAASLTRWRYVDGGLRSTHAIPRSADCRGDGESCGCWRSAGRICFSSVCSLFRNGVHGFTVLDFQIFRYGQRSPILGFLSTYA